MIDLTVIKQKVLSNNIEESVEGIEQAIRIVDEISEILLEGIKQSQDRFISTEKTSLFFYGFLEKLRNYVGGDDQDLSFWASSLLMHYNLRDSAAEKILLDTIEHGDLEKADVATVILCRNKNQKVVHAITERLKDRSLSKKLRDFFIDHLNDMVNK